MGHVTPGPTTDLATDLGSLINRKHRDKVHGYVTQAQADGAKVVTGGTFVEGELANGAYYAPTLITDAAQNSPIVQEELFGPVLTVLPFDSDDEGFELANDTPYGLAASAWTSSVFRSQAATERIQAGCVWINDHISIISEMPHGGYKLSGFGKDMSSYSLEEYTQIKHVMSSITNDARRDWHDVVFTVTND
jgi:betaine-aldehyde dehydrogenase